MIEVFNLPRQFRPGPGVLLLRREVDKGVVVEGVILHRLNPVEVAADRLLDDAGHIFGVAQHLPLPDDDAGARHRVDPFGIDILRHRKVGD